MWTCAYRILVGDLSERGHVEDLGIDGRTILKWIFSLGEGQVVGACECSNDHLSSIKMWRIL